MTVPVKLSRAHPQVYSSPICSMFLLTAFFSHSHALYDCCTPLAPVPTPCLTSVLFSPGPTVCVVSVPPLLFHAQADESIRLLGESMASAVESCTEAACHEPNPGSQQRLLRAAAYGRTYCKVPDRDVVKSACMVLRVLNAIKDPEAAGVPLSYLQFQALGPQEVVTLLLAYHRHLLAMRLSQYLSLPEERVLEHWASAKIAASSFASDDELYGTLMARLGQEKSARLSYARIAEVAHVRNRQRLAARLLEHEASEGRAVALLVRMRQFAVALRKAEACSDADLLYLVLFQIQSHLPEESLFQLLEAFPIARNLFISYTRTQDRDLLRRFLTAWNKPHLVAELCVEDTLVSSSAAAANSHESGGAWSIGMLRDLEEAAKLFDATREHGFQGSSLHEWVKLMKLEQKGENGMNASTRAMLQVSTTHHFASFLPVSVRGQCKH